MIGGGDHLCVLLRDTVLVVNVRLYLTENSTLLVILMSLPFAFLSGRVMFLWYILVAACLILDRSLQRSAMATASVLGSNCFSKFSTLFIMCCLVGLVLLFLWYESLCFVSFLLLFSCQFVYLPCLLGGMCVCSSGD